MKKILTILLIVLFQTMFAQKFEMGKVSIKELTEKIHPLDSSASAAILYKRGNTYFEIDGSNWILVTEVQTRLKIYKKEGYDYATVTVPYYNGTTKGERVIFSDAVTYNLLGDKITTTKLKDDGIFTEDISKSLKCKKITLPNVSEGSVIEYKYIIKSPYIANVPDWYFQNSIPVNYVQYSIAIPELFVYNRILNPYFSIKETEENYKRNIFLLRSKLTMGETKRIYTVENLPALKEESYVDNINNYLAFVKHELASASDIDGKVENYATDWNSVAKTIYEEEDFGKELKRFSYFEKDVAELLKGVESRDDKINAIFNYVKGRMTWDGRYSYECWDGAEKAYANRTGNVGEINLMLTAMLRYAGLTANPVLLSTRENGHVTFISRDSFNYVIAGVEGENGIVLLDATSKNSVPNILPVRDLNGEGRLIRENSTSEKIDLMPQANSLKSSYVMAKISPDGVVTGQVKTRKHDYNALIFRDSYHNTDREDYISKKEKNLDNIKIDSYVVANDKEFTKPIEESFNFTGDNLSDVIGNKIYITPMLFYTSSENPFKQESRSYPIDFVFPHQDKYIINITMPEGYVVESVPESVNVATDPNIGSFKFNITVNANQIQVSVISDINFARVNPEYYGTIKDYYASMVKKQTEKIILVKK